MQVKILPTRSPATWFCSSIRRMTFWPRPWGASARGYPTDAQVQFFDRLRSLAFPVYSTWYTFIRTTSLIWSPRGGAGAGGGLRGGVFIDDRWQRFARDRGYHGCGDWLPDPAGFPTSRPPLKTSTTAAPRGAVDRRCCSVVKATPSARSPASPRTGRPRSTATCSIRATRRCGTRDAHLPAAVRKPSRPTYSRSISWMGRCYAHTAHGDLTGVGQAMAALLGDVRGRLGHAGTPMSPSSSDSRTSTRRSLASDSCAAARFPRRPPRQPRDHHRCTADLGRSGRPRRSDDVGTPGGVRRSPNSSTAGGSQSRRSPCGCPISRPSSRSRYADSWLYGARTADVTLDGVSPPGTERG